LRALRSQPSQQSTERCHLALVPNAFLVVALGQRLLDEGGRGVEVAYRPHVVRRVGGHRREHVGVDVLVRIGAGGDRPAHAVPVLDQRAGIRASLLIANGPDIIGGQRRHPISVLPGLLKPTVHTSCGETSDTAARLVFCPGTLGLGM